MGTNPWEHSEGTCGHTANEDPSALVQLIKFPSLLAVSNIASPFWDLYIGLLPGPHQVKRRGETSPTCASKGGGNFSLYPPKR